MAAAISSRLMVCGMAALALGAAQTNPARAAEDPVAVAPGHALYGDPASPDISGLWLGSYTEAPGYPPQQPVEQTNMTAWAPWPPPLTPAYQKKADVIIAAAKAGRAIGDAGAGCFPGGLPRMLIGTTYPDEIVQTPGQVTVFVYGMFPIVIWTDGRGHPKDLEPSYNGHSIGYWSGDTLYVDTVGILASTPLDSGPRSPHSAKLHLKAAFQRVADDVMHVQVTMYDEDAFAEPMVTTNLWHRKAGPDWQVLDDGSCFENNRNLPDSEDAPGFKTF